MIRCLTARTIQEASRLGEILFIKYSTEQEGQRQLLVATLENELKRRVPTIPLYKKVAEIFDPNGAFVIDEEWYVWIVRCWGIILSRWGDIDERGKIKNRAL